MRDGARVKGHIDGKRKDGMHGVHTGVKEMSKGVEG
jgi:hypothetical protein